MEQSFLTEINIKKVRHLKDIRIPISSDRRKHLILTGKNGSGKTSVLDALVKNLDFIAGDHYYTKGYIEEQIDLYKRELSDRATSEEPMMNYENQKYLSFWEQKLLYWTDGAVADFSSISNLQEKYRKGEYVLAYYRANRLSNVEVSNTIESVQLREKYQVNETPGTQLVRYMAGLKATQAFALQKNDIPRATEIQDWFDRFEGVLKRVFDDPSLKLDFDIDHFTFCIHQVNREPFDFNTMSSGYSAVFDIINDLIMRMEKRKTMKTEGIVLIDEIDTHLHLELQRSILPFLTELFPNIQFIVSTHSPFILNSIENAVIFDLETGRLVENGLAHYPYGGIVEGYFATDALSSNLRAKLDRYKALTMKAELTDEDCAELLDLEQDLDEIPDFLSPEIASEYSRLKLEFSNRG